MGEQAVAYATPPPSPTGEFSYQQHVVLIVNSPAEFGALLEATDIGVDHLGYEPDADCVSSMHQNELAVLLPNHLQSWTTDHL